MSNHPYEQANGQARTQARTQARVAKGVPTGGRFAANQHPEADVHLDAVIDLAPDADPNAERFTVVVDVQPHELTDLGVFTVTFPDGRIAARNTRGPGFLCPVCWAEAARQADCVECTGRGRVFDIPYCDRQWDSVLTTDSGGSLWQGGHECQPGGGDCKPADQFDLVVSLYSREGFDPADGTPHLRHKMIDGPLNPDDHETIERLSDQVADSLDNGEKVLVRCLGGLNRSGLVAGLAAIKQGVPLDDFLAEARAARSPYVLFNNDFVDYLRRREQELRAAA